MDTPDLYVKGLNYNHHTVGVGLNASRVRIVLLNTKPLNSTLKNSILNKFVRANVLTSASGAHCTVVTDQHGT